MSPHLQAPLLDTLDLVVLGTIGLGTVAWVCRNQLMGLLRGSTTTVKANQVSPRYAASNTSATKANGVASTQDGRNFVKKMKEQGRNTIFFYGSQTGTAEDYAARLAKEATQKFGLKTMVADIEEYDMTHLDTLPQEYLAFFVLATYGEGEPTDNAVDFWELLTQDEHPEFSKTDEAEDSEKPLSNLRYVIFGLGNKTYEHYNAVARTVDAKLSALGATRIFERGEGDDDGSLEEDFLGWKDQMWQSVADAMGVDENAARNTDPAFSIEELVSAPEKTYFGELAERRRSIATGTVKPVHDAKNPFAAPIVTRDVFEAGERHCIHGEISIKGSGMTYQTGDHIAIWPVNSEPAVNLCAEALGLKDKLDTVVMVKSTDPTASKQSPFPAPTTYRTILRHYLDISAPPSRQTVAAFAHYATGKTKEIMTKIGSDKDYYREKVTENAPSIGEFLKQAARIAGEPEEYVYNIPFAEIVESISRLQPRYYSISSSSKVHPDTVHVTAVVLQYQTPDFPDRTVYGVGTNYLWYIHAKSSNMAVDSLPAYHIDGPKGEYAPSGNQPQRVPVHIRHSNFKLPRNVGLPIIMVGPGTGVAPFRGFIQERAAQKAEGKEVGKTLLFFGCRLEAEDFMYKGEWLEYFGKLNEANDPQGSRIITAFSRDDPSHKVYVQHRLKEQAQEVWEMLQKGAYVYVCGDAKNMAKDVQNEFINMAKELGGLSEDKATAFVKNLRGRGRYQEDVWS
ncbi:hypothetical protein BZG36_04484 [Bifiguratus adelaidae]|uniref:NADPH--cytochrome P450 reductase n=1 Tax=Bifiguratus adelaidae TaxID=1938954 RepID=A0A261XYR1_9FUNG|nr:hypothetical protein BZG36_04484 [Bifiguratus adelaidae]